MTTDNIKVAIRVRPPIRREIASKLGTHWMVQNQNIFAIDQDGNRIAEPYTFDYIFDETNTNCDIYKAIIQPLIQSSLEGYNSTIFAYGQTSSGKTHTILGSPTESGIMKLVVEEVFDHIAQSPTKKFLIRVSCLEIYNERVNDLLDVSNVDIKALTQEIATNKEQALKLIKQGNKNRKIGGTEANDRSSRSHIIVRLIVEFINDSKDVQISSHINLVDLAGSERVASTKAEGVRLAEGLHINKSLSTLSLVIKQLSENERFVNFRDSKLTRLLQNALGGNTKTLIIANVTTASMEETNSTLSFAQRAKAVKNKPVINKVVRNDEQTQHFRDLLEEYKKRFEDERNKTIALEFFVKSLPVSSEQPSSVVSKKTRRHTFHAAIAEEGEPETFDEAINLPSKLNLLEVPPEEISELYTHLEKSYQELLSFTRHETELKETVDLNKVRSDYVDLYTLHEDLLRSNANLKTEFAQVTEEQNRKYTEEIQSLKKTNETLSSQLNIIKNQKTNSETMIDQIKIDNEYAMEQMTKKFKQKEELFLNEINELRLNSTRRATSQEHKQRDDEKTMEFNTKYQLLKNENDLILQQISALQEKLEESNKINLDYDDRLFEMLAEIKELKNKNNELENKCQEYEEVNEHIKKNRNELILKQRNVFKDSTMLSEEHMLDNSSAAQEQITKSVTTLDNSNKQLENSQQELEKVNEELLSLRKEYTETMCKNQELEQLKEELIKTKEMLDNRKEEQADFEEKYNKTLSALDNTNKERDELILNLEQANKELLTVKEERIKTEEMLENHRKEHETSKLELNQIQERLEILEKEHNNSLKILNEANKERDECKQNLQKVNENVLAVEEERTKTEEILEKRSQELAQSKLELNQIQERLETLEKEHNNTLKILNQTNKERDECKPNLQYFNEELIKTKTMLYDLEHKHNKTLSTLYNTNKERDELKLNLEQTKKELLTVKEERIKTEEMLEKHNKEHAKSKLELNQIQDKLKTLETEHTNTLKILNEAYKERDECQLNLQKLNEELLTFKEERIKTEKMLEKHNQEHAKSKLVLNQIQDKLKTLEKQHTNTLKILNEAYKERDECQLNLQKLNEELLTFKEERIKTEEILQKPNKELAKSKLELKQVQEQLETLLEKHNNTLKILNDSNKERDECKLNLQRINEELLNLKEERIKLNEKLNQTSKILYKTNKERDGFELNLQEVNKQLLTLHEQHKEILRKNEDQEQINKDMETLQHTIDKLQTEKNNLKELLQTARDVVMKPDEPKQSTSTSSRVMSQDWRRRRRQSLVDEKRGLDDDLEAMVSYLKTTIEVLQKENQEYTKNASKLSNAELMKLELYDQELINTDLKKEIKLLQERLEYQRKLAQKTSDVKCPTCEPYTLLMEKYKILKQLARDRGHENILLKKKLGLDPTETVHS